jgi:hypothetical protein
MVHAEASQLVSLGSQVRQSADGSHGGQVKQPAGVTWVPGEAVS